MVVPSSLLVVLSWSVFWMNTKKLALRVAVGVLLGDCKIMRNHLVIKEVIILFGSRAGLAHRATQLQQLDSETRDGSVHGEHFST